MISPHAILYSPLDPGDPHYGEWLSLERSEVSTSLPPIGAEIKITRIGRNKLGDIGANEPPTAPGHYKSAKGIVVGHLRTVWGPAIQVGTKKYTRDYPAENYHGYNPYSSECNVLYLYPARGDEWEVYRDVTGDRDVYEYGLTSGVHHTGVQRAQDGRITSTPTPSKTEPDEGNSPMFSTDTIDTVNGVCGVLKAEIDGKSVIFWQGNPHDEEEETPKDKTVSDVARAEAKKAAKVAIKNLVSTLDTPPAG